MRTARFGLAAVAALALALAGAATAVAYTYAPPEFGRCAKNAKGEAGAGFSNSGCTERVASGAKYHWLSGPGAKNGFSASGSAALYQSSGASHKKAVPSVECSSSSTTGSFTGPASESLTLVLSGCKMGSSSCQSAGQAAGVVRFEALEGLLVLDKREYWGEALVQWNPASGETLASFECGATSVLVTGGIMHPIKRNKMVSSEPEQLKTWKEGEQRPDCRETIVPYGEPYPGPTCVYPSVSIGGAPAVIGGLAISGTQTDEEAIEANTLLG